MVAPKPYHFHDYYLIIWNVCCSLCHLVARQSAESFERMHLISLPFLSIHFFSPLFLCCVIATRCNVCLITMFFFLLYKKKIMCISFLFVCRFAFVVIEQNKANEGKKNKSDFDEMKRIKGIKQRIETSRINTECISSALCRLFNIQFYYLDPLHHMSMGWQSGVSVWYLSVCIYAPVFFLLYVIDVSFFGVPCAMHQISARCTA